MGECELFVVVCGPGSGTASRILRLESGSEFCANHG